ncbi:MAG: hypothetical protein JSU04_05180 [Bdellovibrionales bacterium]|nr:hypothetical protein [Bdellovibrionales bacterium]
MTKLFSKSSIALVVLTALACSHLTMKRLPAASEPFAPVEAGNVFASYEPLQVELEAPLADLFARKSMGLVEFKKGSVEGTFSYWNEQKQKISLPVSVSVKGFTSTELCDFPKLEIKFTSKERGGTLFETTKTVDMNTHCGSKAGGAAEVFLKAAAFNHREALLYRMAEVLRIPTFKARPVFVKYNGTKIAEVDQSKKPFQAFLLEDTSSFTKRLGGREIKGTDDPMKPLTLALQPQKAPMFAFTNVKQSPQIDPEDAARIGYFQKMIGNSDWYIKMTPEDTRSGDAKINLWNTKIIELPNGKWVLFPQDFNFSAIMIGAYNSSADLKTINSVDPATQVRLKQVFIEKKAELYKLTDTLTNDPEGPEFLKRVLDAFYKDL